MDDERDAGEPDDAAPDDEEPGGDADVDIPQDGLNPDDVSGGGLADWTLLEPIDLEVNQPDEPDEIADAAYSAIPYDAEGPDLFDTQSGTPPESPAASSGEPVPAGWPAATSDPTLVGEDVGQLPAQPTGVEPSEPPLALYRRYRPDTFADVIGQEHVTEPLMRAITNNKVAHAYLFSGPRGCGKTTCARILARCLNCEQGPTPTPCGVCQSCRDLATGGPGSIDVIEIDAASHGRVDDARELREAVYFAPVQSRYKIYIIDEAHQVTKEGFNALLKTVEEPPPHVKFIFATTEPDKVIGTIRSRTHHYPFRLVPPKTLSTYLQKICNEEQVAVEPGVLPLVVRAGAGSVRDCLSVLDQLLGSAGEHGVSYRQAAALLGYTPDALLDEIVDAFAAGDAKGVFECIDKVIESGQDPRRFGEDLLQRLRDLLIVAQVPDAIATGLIDVSADQAERLTSQAAGMGAGELTRAAEVLAEGLTAMRGTTAPRLQLELMCSRVLLPGADVDDRGIHARLERLERRVGMAVPGAAQSSGAVWGAGQSDTAERPTAAALDPRRGSASGNGVQLGSPTQDAQRLVDDATPAPRGGRPRAAASAGPAQTETSASPVGFAEVSSPLRRVDEPSAANPTRQRPADARRAHQPTPAPAVTPTGSDVPGSPSSAPTALSTAELRRLWPQVLDQVKSRRRYAWILLSQNAQVSEVSADSLTLTFTSSGARDSFLAGGSHDVLRDCLIDVVGADLRIVAQVNDGSTGSDGSGSLGSGPMGSGSQRGGTSVGRPGRPRRPAGAAGGAREGQSQTSAQAADPPEDPGDSHDDPPERRADAPGGYRDRPGDGGIPPSVDDETVDDPNLTASQLVMHELGAELIEDEDE